MGKSVLLDAAAQAAQARGFRLLRASGVEFVADVGYSGLNQLLLWPPGEEFGRLAPEANVRHGLIRRGFRDASEVPLPYPFYVKPAKAEPKKPEPKTVKVSSKD